MAARAHEVDAFPPRPGGDEAVHGAVFGRAVDRLRRHERGCDLLHAAARARNRDHWAIGAQAVRFLLDRRRRHLRRVARVRSEGKGSFVLRGARSAHARRAGLAPRVATEARSEALAALPSLPHARRETVARAWRSGRARYRDLAYMHRRAGGLSDRDHGPRKGLRARRRSRVAVEHEKPDARLRALYPRR